MPKVLVIDDEHQILVLVKHSLERAGFSVVTVSDPLRAVETAAREMPNIIVSDLMMPKLDGYGVLNALRQNPLTATIPVVFLSAAPPHENMPRAFAHGVVGYFEKPFHPARLGKQLSDLLANLGQRRNEWRGSLRKTPLAFIVQMMARERRTGLLSVRAPEVEGRVVFHQGIAKDASLGQMRGEGALTALGQLSEGEFTLSGLDGAQSELVELGEDDFVEQTPPPAPVVAAPPAEDALKVLVVDDESSVVKMIEKAMLATGYAVTTAANGRVAFERAVELRPDVVICDIMMPEMDGWQFYHQLRADFRINEARFIFLSAYPDLEQRLRDIGVSADGYVAKGSMLSALIQRVEHLVKPRRDLASLLKGKMRGTYTGRVEALGAKHVLRMLHAARFTGTLSVENVWHKLACEFAHGQPASVLDRGMVESSGALAFEELCAQTAGDLTISGQSANLKANIDQPFERLMRESEEDLTQAEQRVVDTNLVSAMSTHVDERVLDFYMQLAPTRLMPILQAVRSGQLPRDVIASVDLPPTEVEEVLRDLVRKRVLSFDTLG